ncbi:hypothetical protein RintRC_2289 [Richelia intracellularis]|nr:hypothetical protein RintRC_2289 [Richelia intracellularis]
MVEDGVVFYDELIVTLGPDCRITGFTQLSQLVGGWWVML